MNKDILVGNWKQLRGQVKAVWGRLTDDEIDEINGRLDQLIGKLQERYGYTHQQAEQQVHYFVDYVENDLLSTPSGVIRLCSVCVLSLFGRPPTTARSPTAPATPRGRPRP